MKKLLLALYLLNQINCTIAGKPKVKKYFFKETKPQTTTSISKSPHLIHSRSENLMKPIPKETLPEAW